MKNKKTKTSFFRPRTLMGIGFFLASFGALAAVEITLPRVEMASRGWSRDDEFVVSSFLTADINLSGGYKYAFLLGFSLEAPDIVKALTYRNFMVDPLAPGGGVNATDYNLLADRFNNQAAVGFRVAKATARELFGLPLELSYFVGQGDDFCTGDEYLGLFGAAPFGTGFRGFFYFPDGIGGNPMRRYNGIHGARGTGFSLGLTAWEFLVPVLYLYQDFAFADNLSGTVEENYYSGDIRLLFYRERLRFEAFGGASVKTDLDTSIRGGLMLHLAGNGVEFFAQGGVPGWTKGEDFSIDNVFFLLEPRLLLDNFGLYLTFFYHPVEYHHIITDDERGKADINIKFLFGAVDSGFTGGIETGAWLKTDGLEDFEFRVCPFGTFVSGGLTWDAKIQIKPLSYQTPREMIDFFIGVRTGF